jgi:hypothetical protein
MKLKTILTLATSALAAVSATHHTSYNIHRRLLDPSHPSSFSPYGTVETDIDVASYALALRTNTGAIVPPHGKFIPAENSGGKDGGEVDVTRAWVQVTVEVEGRDEEEWPRSAVKAVSTIQERVPRFVCGCVSGRGGCRDLEWREAVRSGAMKLERCGCKC